MAIDMAVTESKEQADILGIVRLERFDSNRSRRPICRPSNSAQKHDASVNMTQTLSGMKRKLDTTNGCNGVVADNNDDDVHNNDNDTNDRLSPIPKKMLKFDQEDTQRDVLNFPRSARFWLAVDFVTTTTTTTSAHEGRNLPTISQISAALGHITSRKCIGRWIFNIKQPALLESTMKQTKMTPPSFQKWNFDTNNEIKTSELHEALSLIISSVESVCSNTFDHDRSISNGGDIVLVTDGHISLRNGLHRDLVHCGVPQSIAAHSLWWSYLEVGQLASEMQPSTISVVGLDQALSALNLPSMSKGTCLSVVDGLNCVVEMYLAQGYALKNPQKISSEYIPMVIPEGFEVTPGTVVEVRQLPWTATPYTIASFFRGLNIRPGGIAIKILDGRRSNTVYVCFETLLDSKLACARDQMELTSTSKGNFSMEDSSSSGGRHGAETKRNRPTALQVFPSNEKFFLQHAVCRLTDVANFLNQVTGEKQIVVRMRGLPYSTKKQHIVDFFDQVHATILNDADGIYFVNYCDRRPTGDAFVIFTDDEAADRALTRHRNYLGQRYVELFKASPSEQVQVCQSVSKSDGFQGKTAKSLRLHAVSMDSSLQMKFAANLNDGVNAAASVAFQASLANQLFYPNLLSQPLCGHFNGLASPISVYVNSGGSQGSPDLLTPDSFCKAEGLDAATDNSNDPTDPNSAFQRPLPVLGAQYVLQVLDLPPPITRHDMRLYLGAVNFAKVYRMCKMVDGSSNGSWLLLLVELSDAFSIIESLVQKPISLTPGLNLPSQTINPRFIIYEMNNLNQLAILPMERLPPNISRDRLINMQMHSQMQSPMSFPKPQSVLTPNRYMKMDHFNQNVPSSVLSLDALRQLTVAPKGRQSIGQPFNFAHTPMLNVADFSLTSPVMFMPGQPGIDWRPSLPTLVPEGVGINAPLLNEPCILQVIGLPQNVSMPELTSLCSPVAHLLSMQPQFVPFQVHEGGTCTYLASFASRADADLVTVNCPLGSLRDNTFITLMCPIPSPSPQPLVNRIPTVMPLLSPFYQIQQ